MGCWYETGACREGNNAYLAGMSRSVEAIIDEQGQVRLLKPLRFPTARRAVVMILDDDPLELAHVSEPALAEDWELGLGKLAQPIRLAMCGGSVSPPIDATLAILGKTEALARLYNALAAWGA